MDRTEKSKDVAGPGPCLECGHPEHTPENRFCGRCGASLERSLVRSGGMVPRAKESRVTPRGRFLRGGLGPVGKTVAASLAVVAADVGLAWLRHWLEKTDRAALPALPHDTGRAWREEGSGGGPECLHAYLLEEAALLLGEGRGTLGWYSSELTIRSSRVEK